MGSGSVMEKILGNKAKKAVSSARNYRNSKGVLQWPVWPDCLK